MKKMLFIILLPFLSVIVGAQELKENQKSPQSSSQFQEKIYKIADQMPMFPGCDNKVSKFKKERCTNVNMYKYIYNNLKYPESAIMKNVEGKVMVQFAISKVGKVFNVKVLNDIGEGYSDAAKDVILSMNRMSKSWIPGRIGGENVNVWYTIPIIFEEEEEFHFEDQSVDADEEQPMFIDMDVDKTEEVSPSSTPINKSGDKKK